MKKDSINIILAFFGTVLFIYGLPKFGLPNIVNQVIFLLLIAYIYTEKNDIFWLVWFFIVVDAPGRLFSSGYASNVYRLPLYNITSGISLSFTDLFILMYIVKSFRYRISTNFIFKRQIWFFISTALVYFIISFVIGISLPNIILTSRSILPWFWVLIIPRYVTSREDLKRVYLLITPAVIIAFIALMQTYITGIYLHSILSGTSATRWLDASEGSLVRIYSAAYITFVATVLSLYFLSLRKAIVNANLLILIAFLGTISVFLSATRGWTLALVVLYSSFFFISGFGMFKQMVRVLVIISLSILVIITIFPTISTQGSLAFQRLLTLEDLAQGDLTAGGTLSRLTERSPRVMAVFRESPLIGWAFSNRFYAFADVHVGNQTNLLNLGILGFLAISLVYISIILKTLQRGRSWQVKHESGNSYLVFLFALFALFIAHSSSGSLWGFLDSSPTVRLLFAFIFVAISVELNVTSSHPSNV